ncbi:hypothetical protein E3H11_43325 [Bradyrhizobium brasilense]|nr:hypothetical protein [Bradyrhizobium brasilense]
MSIDMFKKVLDPENFEVKVYPHNHELGAEIFNDKLGKAPLKYRLANLLSGRNPSSRESALSLMCVARKAID